MAIVLEVLIVTVVAFIAGNFVGYLIHRILHCRWAGKAYDDHLYHHSRIYPPNDYLSKEYRHPPEEAEQGKYYLLGLVILAAPLLLWSWAYFLLAFGVGVLDLKANDWMHKCVHLRGHWLERFPWFLKLREIHFQHHLDVRTNLGILSFFPDKVIGTYSGPTPVGSEEA